MPEGPLGFPRITNLGPLVKKEPEELLREIQLRSHSWRGYEPEEFIRLNNSGVNNKELGKHFRVIEAGRFNDMLREAYDFWIPLDPDEKEEFASLNPDLVRWLEVYAMVEDLRKPSEDIDI